MTAHPFEAEWNTHSCVSSRLLAVVLLLIRGSVGPAQAPSDPAPSDALQGIIQVFEGRSIQLSAVSIQLLKQRGEHALYLGQAAETP